MKTIEEECVQQFDNYAICLALAGMPIGEVEEPFNEGFNKGVEFAQHWIPVEEELPEYEQSVLVYRPNKYSGKVDILLAKLHKAKEDGTEYGSGNGMGGGYPKTFKDYWSLPAIVLLNTITHWRPIELRP